jgi:hypothetical protein
LLPAAYALAFALALGATLAAGLGVGGRNAARPVSHDGPALVVLPSLGAQEAFFGDDVTARVEVIVDGTRIHDSSVDVRTTFAPYSVAASDVARQSLGGGYLRRIYTYRLRCLQTACLPAAGGKRDFRFPPVEVSVEGRPVQTSPWPQLLVVSRLHGKAGLRLSSLRRPADVSATGRQLSSSLTWGGGALGLLGLALLAAWSVTRARPPALPVTAAGAAAELSDPVAEACGRVRAILSDGSWTRRQGALDVLARQLSARGDEGLADEASSLAWGRARPSEAEVSALLDRVEKREGDEAEAEDEVVAA